MTAEVNGLFQEGFALRADVQCESSSSPDAWSLWVAFPYLPVAAACAGVELEQLSMVHGQKEVHRSGTTQSL